MSLNHKQPTVALSVTTRAFVHLAVSAPLVWVTCGISLTSAGQTLVAVGEYSSGVIVEGQSQADWRTFFRVSWDHIRQLWHIEDLSRPGRHAYTASDHIVDTNFTVSTNSPVLQISQFQDGYPIDLDADQRLIWFAYCAKQYLVKKNGQPVIIPTGDPRYDLELHACRLKTTWHSDAAVCPDTADFVVDPSLMHRATYLLTFEPEGDFLRERFRRIQAIRAVLARGDTLARFSVLSWTNIARNELPLTWMLEIYSRGRVIRRAEGVANQVFLTNVLTLPRVPQIAQIRDIRARDAKTGINYLRYNITDGKIPDLTDDRAQKAILAMKDPTRAVLPTGSRPARFVIILILCWTSIVFVWFCSRRASKSGTFCRLKLR